MRQRLNFGDDGRRDDAIDFNEADGIATHRIAAQIKVRNIDIGFGKNSAERAEIRLKVQRCATNMEIFPDVGVEKLREKPPQLAGS